MESVNHFDSVIEIHSQATEPNTNDCTFLSPHVASYSSMCWYIRLVCTTFHITKHRGSRILTICYSNIVPLQDRYLPRDTQCKIAALPDSTQLTALMPHKPLWHKRIAKSTLDWNHKAANIPRVRNIQNPFILFIKYYISNAACPIQPLASSVLRIIY